MGRPDSSLSPPKRCTDCANTVRDLPRNAGRALIWIYRHTLSPLVGYNCRHLPTCSVYGDEAIERFGLCCGGGGGGSADDVASAPAEPSSGSLTDSSKFDSGVRQR